MTQFWHVDIASETKDRMPALNNLAGAILHSAHCKAIRIRSAKWNGAQFASDDDAKAMAVEVTHEDLMAKLKLLPVQKFTFDGDSIAAIAVEVL